MTYVKAGSVNVFNDLVIVKHLNGIKLRHTHSLSLFLNDWED